MRGIGKRFVYILRSDVDPERHYVGITSDVKARLDWHNGGPCGYTVRHRPWSIAVCIEFPTETQAVRFEKYLKSGSGRAFAKRHFDTLLGGNRVKDPWVDRRSRQIGVGRSGKNRVPALQR